LQESGRRRIPVRLAAWTLVVGGLPLGAKGIKGKRP